MKYTLFDYERGGVAYFRVIENSFRNSPTYQLMNPIIPPSLLSALSNGQEITDDEVVAAVRADKTRQSDVAIFMRLIEDMTPRIEEFLSRFDTGVWFDDISVHFTRYGTGGSYHSAGKSLFHTNAITIRDPMLQRSQTTLLENVMHETIHLMIDAIADERELQYQQKEAIVDKICMSNEVMYITGRRYNPQSPFVGNLPPDWMTYVLWKPERRPVW